MPFATIDSLVARRALAPRSLASAAIGVGLGIATWSFTEYATHRWLLHGPFGRGRLARVPIGSVHRHHHAEPLATVPAARLAACSAMLGIGVAAGPRATRLLPAAMARAATLTWGSGYSVYDVVHWSLHHRRPRTRLGRAMRQRHFRHHFRAPGGNHGVTMSWWDRVFGTEIPDGSVTVPTRHAPQWLGQLGPSFRTPPA